MTTPSSRKFVEVETFLKTSHHSIASNKAPAVMGTLIAMVTEEVISTHKSSLCRLHDYKIAYTKGG
jgi:hypothetical protein